MTNQEIKDTGLLIRNEQHIGGNTALRVGGVIEGIGDALNNKDAANGYYEARMSGGSIIVTAPNYVLGTGGNLRLKMPAAGTAASTLTIGNANQVPLLYNGAAVSSRNGWDAGEIIDVFYDGQNFLASNSEGGGDVKVEDNITGADLDINDDSNNTLARFSDGHFKTKNFDSRDLKTFVGESENADLDITDEENNILARFSDGHVKTKNFDSREQGVFVDNEVNTDLDFSDENNNVVMRVADGHVRTKYFNSSVGHLIVDFIKNKFRGLRCAIVGDSISSYVGTSPSGYQERYPDGDVTNVNQMWWKIVCDTLEMIPVNCSWRGTKVVGAPKGNATAACSDARVADIGRDGAPDIVIFYIGCNDWGSSNSPVADFGTWNVDDLIVDDSGYSSTQTLTDFGAAYSLMLAKTHKAYPHAKLYCCTIMDELLRDDDKQYPPINARGVSNYTWNAKIKDITEALGASCINVHDCGVNCFNIIYYCTDDTGSQGTALHPNKAGMALIAQKVISALIAE